MLEQLGASVERPRASRFGIAPRGAVARWLALGRWEYAVAVLALVSAVAAFWITLRAGFLAYPGWLAVQKADFILGPVGVGLYWRHRRPNNRLGLLLIALGLAGVPYVLESSTVPGPFGVGVLAETAIYVMTSVVILAFPSGRIEGTAARLIIAVVVVASAVFTPVFVLAAPHLGPAFSISGCRAAGCPANGLAIWSPPSWLPQLADVQGALLVAVPIATAGVLVRRFVTGTPPRRRALAIGAPDRLPVPGHAGDLPNSLLLRPERPGAERPPGTERIAVDFCRSPRLHLVRLPIRLDRGRALCGRMLRRLVHECSTTRHFAGLGGLLGKALGDPGS